METKYTNKLKIHKLSQEQYDREKEAGRLDNSAIYLTPYESDGSSTGSSNNASSHKVYYDIMRDTTAVWGDNNGAIVVIPEGTTEIANGAYNQNKSVKVVVIPDSVTNIGYNAFLNCTSLTSVEIPDSVTTLGTHAFYDCDALTSVSIGNSVASIREFTFSGCSSLTSVEIGDSVTSIDNWAFSDCTSLTSIELPESVTSIGSYAFEGCSSLRSIEIPNSVTSICDEAFNGCSNLQYTIKDNIKYLGNQNNPYRCLLGVTSTNITSASIDEKCKVICDWAFEDCRSLTDIVIPDSVTHIGDDPFISCSKLTNVYITDIEAWCNISFGGISDPAPDTANPLYRAKNLYLNNELVTELVIPDTVTEIKPYAFSYCNSLTSVEIPDSVTSIGKGAFDECDGLTSVTIGNSVTSISDSMFADCENLTSIELPESVTSIGKYAFTRCFNLPNITIPNNVTSIGEDAFFACRKLTDIEISSNVNSIGEGAFSSCEKLSTITVAANNTVYKSIDNVLYTKDGRTLMQYAPAKSETSFTIPSSVASISHRAFAECANLSSIVIPDGVTSVGSFAFNGCDKLASVVIGNGITNIDTHTFNMCYKLQNVTIGSSVTNIDYNAFTSIDSDAVITILATTPPTLDTNAFSDPARIIVPEGSLQAYCEAEVWRDFIRVIEDSAGNKVAFAEYSSINELLTNEDDLAEGQATCVTLGTSASIVGCHPEDNRIIVKEGEDRLCVMLSDDIISELGYSINVGDTIEFSSEAISTLMRDQGTLVFIPSAISDYSQDVNFDNVDTADHFIEYTYNNYTYLNQDIQDAGIAKGYLPVPVALEINADNLRNVEQFDSEDENGNSVTHFVLTIADENGEAGEPITICSYMSGFDSDSYTPYYGTLDSSWLDPNNHSSGSYAICGYILTWTDSLKLMLPTRIEEI